VNDLLPHLPSSATRNRAHERRHKQPAASHLRKKHVRLQIGEVMASAEPVVLQTLLGSCVAVCLHDPQSHLGGMNHILLPGSCSTCPGARFGEQAMERLMDQLMKLGANRGALVAKAFGGANVLPCFQSPTIGEENAKFVRRFLATRGIPLIAQRLGGDHAVQLSFSTDTGKASVRAVDGSRLPAISSAEESYVHAVDMVRKPV
jgi:chemotaxis receptor (MCP) glutamine deamidase CheD